MSYLRFSLLIISLCFITTYTYEENVKVTLYYESLCPFCTSFILHHLYPGMEEIGDYVTLDAVPFGNAVIDPISKNVTCQHGPHECYGHKVHACAIANHSQTEWLDFIYCNIKNRVPYKDSVNEKCAVESNLSWKNIKSCIDSRESDKLILNYGKVSKKAHVYYTPHIVFNNVVNNTLERYSQQNFVGTIGFLLNEKPKICEKQNYALQ